MKNQNISSTIRIERTLGILKGFADKDGFIQPSFSMIKKAYEEAYPNDTASRATFRLYCLSLCKSNKIELTTEALCPNSNKGKVSSAIYRIVTEVAKVIEVVTKEKKVEAKPSDLAFVEKNGKQFVSAKELYNGLGLKKANWSVWHKNNIQNNAFFKENEDWVGFMLDMNGNNTLDFDISIDFAKHLAMKADTTKSHDYRNYFINCEKELLKPKFQLPTSFSEALRLLADSTETNEKLVVERQLLLEAKIVVEEKLEVVSAEKQILKEMLTDRISPAEGWDFIVKLRNSCARKFRRGHGEILGGAYGDINLMYNTNLTLTCTNEAKAIAILNGKKKLTIISKKQLIIDGKAIVKSTGKEIHVSDVYASLLFYYDNGHFKKYRFQDEEAN